MPTPANSGKRIITIQPLHISAAAVKFSSIVTRYTDTWTPQWRQEFVYGRMDPISFYGGTDRKITLGFRVVSENISEAAVNMRAIERLLQFQYPTFEAQQGTTIATVKAPPYFQVKLFNVANVGSERIQGYFSGPISINPGFGDKTKNQYYNSTYTKLLFSDVEIVLQMVVLHQKAVGFYGNKFGGLGHSYPYNIAGTVEGAEESRREQEASVAEARALAAELAVIPGTTGELESGEVGLVVPLPAAPTVKPHQDSTAVKAVVDTVLNTPKR